MKTFASIILHLSIGAINILTWLIILPLKGIIWLCDWLNNYIIVKIQYVLGKLENKSYPEEIEHDKQVSIFDRLDDIPFKYIEKYVRMRKINKLK